MLGDLFIWCLNLLGAMIIVGITMVLVIFIVIFVTLFVKNIFKNLTKVPPKDKKWRVKNTYLYENIT